MDLCPLYGIVCTLERAPMQSTVFYEYCTSEDTRDQGTDIPADRAPRSILCCAETIARQSREMIFLPHGRSGVW
jgi:hypothetical protein